MGQPQGLSHYLLHQSHPAGGLAGTTCDLEKVDPCRHFTAIIVAAQPFHLMDLSGQMAVDQSLHQVTGHVEDDHLGRSGLVQREADGRGGVEGVG